MAFRKKTIISFLLFMSLLASGLFLGVMPSQAADNPVVIENQQAGTDTWQIGLPGYTRSNDSNNQIRGYASATSVNKGESINFHITVNPTQTYMIDVYRIGWYQGKGGRLMQHIGPLNGIKQPTCPMDSTTGMISCPWTASYTLNVPTAWTSGVYLALLTNALNYQSYITFVVRDDTRTADLLYQQPVTTYEAYNNYPSDGLTGKSLYDGDSYGAKTALRTQRAVKVSFDRPYTYADHTGAGDFFRWEIYFIRWLERSGYDVNYSTDIDTHTNGSRLLNYKAFLSVGHDEYWSKEMYDAAEAARDAGVSLGFFGANPIYFQIRLEPSASGVPNRVVTCYKDSKLDPLSGSNTTVSWRVSLLNRPEQKAAGVQYNTFIDAALPGLNYIIQNSSHWVYSGTGFKDGDAVAGILGYEMDQFMPNYPLPPAVDNSQALLSNSPFRDGNNTNTYANSSIYKAASGAWVFGAGTMAWAWGLENYTPPGAVNTGGHMIADPRVQKVTENLLNTFITRNLPATNIAPPSNLATTLMSMSQIDLSWVDNANNEDGFVLERSTDQSFTNVTPITLPANASSYSDQVNAGTYYYRLKATNASGSSAYSTVLAAIMPPAAPTNLTATAMSSAQINLSWTDNAANEHAYVVERSSDNVNWTVLDANVPPDSTSYGSSGLTALTTYYYRVKASNATADSAYSNSVSATTTDSVIYAADAFTRTVNSGWGNADIGGAYSLGGGLPANFNVNGSTGVIVSDATAERQARLNVAQQDITMLVRVATDKLAAGGSEKPRLVVRRVDAKNYYAFEVAFTTSKSVQTQIQSFVNNVQTTLKTATVSGVTHNAVGQYYWVKVQTVGISPTTLNMKVWPDGTVEPSVWTITATDSAPVLQVAAPVALGSTMSMAATNSPITFSWDDLAVKDVPPVLLAPQNLAALPLATTETYLTWNDKTQSKEFYTIERSTDGVNWHQVARNVPAARRRYVDKQLKAETRYYYRIKSTSTNGESAWSEMADVTTYDEPRYIVDDDDYK